jgi:hypothetical protein
MSGQKNLFDLVLRVLEIVHIPIIETDKGVQVAVMIDIHETGGTITRTPKRKEKRQR